MGLGLQGWSPGFFGKAHAYNHEAISVFDSESWALGSLGPVTAWVHV